MIEKEKKGKAKPRPTPTEFLKWREGPCPICDAPREEGMARLEHFLGHIFDEEADR